MKISRKQREAQTRRHDIEVRITLDGILHTPSTAVEIAEAIGETERMTRDALESMFDRNLITKRNVDAKVYYSHKCLKWAHRKWRTHSNEQLGIEA